MLGYDGGGGEDVSLALLPMSQGLTKLLLALGLMLFLLAPSNYVTRSHPREVDGGSRV